jgi:threonine dehydrogenase-like Zn-dependent dehydrogenase
VKALAWHGKGDIRCDDVSDPRIEHARDAIIKVTACAICGSDLHIYGGIIPSMQSGDIPSDSTSDPYRLVEDLFHCGRAFTSSLHVFEN